MPRKLAAILAADVVGYSHLMGMDEAGTLERLKSLRKELVQPTVTAHGGRIVKLMGDGLLAEFSSVVEAVQCAVDIQQAMVDHEPDISDEKRIRLRIGVNLGDIIVEGSDIYGDGVNVASRLEGLADPGGICISGPAFDTIDGKLDLAFEDVGEHQMKNIAKPVRVHRLVFGAVRVGSTTPPTKPLPLPDKPSIAVLPFENLSGNPEQEYFADGITEDIITELSRFRSMFVIARNSSFAYKDQTVDVRQVAEELGVRYIVEGSIRKAGARIRVNVQLIDAPTRKQVWAERYDRDLDDLFEVQDKITRIIVAAIEPELGSAERDRARRSPPDNLDAWGLYQRGLWHAFRFSAKDNAEARLLFERASTVDPNFAPAFAGLSFTHIVNAFLGYEKDRDRCRDQALEAAKRSVALDDRDETAHWALGRAYLICGEHDRAIKELEAAIELNPNYAQAHYNLGWALLLASRPAEALPYLDLAERLSPHDPLLFAFCIMRAQSQFLTGDIDYALEEARRSSRQPNAHANSRAVFVSILGQLGRFEEARAELALLLATRPDYTQKDFAMSFPYKRAEDMECFLEGLAAVGLPE